MIFSSSCSFYLWYVVPTSARVPSACARNRPPPPAARGCVRRQRQARAQADAKHRDEQRMLADERDVLHQEMSRIQNRLKLTLQVLLSRGIPRRSHGAWLAAAATRVRRAVLRGTRRAAQGAREYLE